jgi:hypothetical protein
MVDKSLASASRLIYGWLSVTHGWLISEVLVIVYLVAASTRRLAKIQCAQ